AVPQLAATAARYCPAMSHENIEVFKRGAEAYKRQDVEALLKTLDPEVEWHSALLIHIRGARRPSVGDTAASVRCCMRFTRLSPRSTSRLGDSGTWVIESSRSPAAAPGQAKRGGDRDGLRHRHRPEERQGGFGTGPTSIPKSPSKPPGCRSSGGKAPAFASSSPAVIRVGQTPTWASRVP